MGASNSTKHNPDIEKQLSVSAHSNRTFLQSKTTGNRILLVAGYRDEVFGEFTDIHPIISNSSGELLQIQTDLLIRYIYSGWEYTIYADAHHTKFWATGKNIDSQCVVSSTHHKIANFTPIKYFEKNKIKIVRLCASAVRDSMFWISARNQVYITGDAPPAHARYPRDASKDPMLLSSLKIDNVATIITIQYPDKPMVLCSNKHNLLIVIESFFKSSTIPTEIIYLIIAFYSKNNKMYTKTLKYNRFEPYLVAGNDIVKIACGQMYTLYLQFNGKVLQKTVNNPVYTYKSLKFDHLFQHRIRIIDIACGLGHNLLLCELGKVYACGFNENNQCGQDTSYNVEGIIKMPTIIEYFKCLNVLEIKCGSHHSYVKSNTRNHYLFGRNQDNECISNCDLFTVNYAHCINDSDYKIFKKKVILSVSLGFKRTKIILVDKKKLITTENDDRYI
eukprot:523265_1